MKTKLARPGLAQKLAREQTAPGKRSDGVLRLVLISDTHDQRPADVPLGDVLIHAGDFACGDDLHSLRRDIGRLRSLPHRHKILVPGNHDLILTIQPNVRELLGSIHFLSDSLVDIDGVRFLNECESVGIPILQCSPYVREWMQRERNQPKSAPKK